MSDAIGIVAVAVAVWVLWLVWCACGRDAGALLQHYADLDADDMVSPADPDPGS